MNYDSRWSIQWVAGLFEGEGCITLYKDKRADYTCVTLTVMMTDEDVIQTLKDKVECGTIVKPKIQKDYHKQPFKWTCSSKPDVYKLLLQIRPHLHSRRQAKCDEALAVLMKDKRVQSLSGD